jgi:hypothetical protein
MTYKALPGRYRVRPSRKREGEAKPHNLQAKRAKKKPHNLQAKRAKQSRMISKREGDDLSG